MTTAKEKAEAYVREKLPELKRLSRGCLLAGKYASEDNPDKYYISDGTLGGGWSVKTDGKVSYANSPMPDGSSSIEIIGHPIQLQHWLRVIDWSYLSAMPSQEILTVHNYPKGDEVMRFNLITGQPATEEDYKAFLTLVGENTEQGLVNPKEV